MKDDDDKLLLCNTVILQICNIFIDSEEDSEKEGEAIRPLRFGEVHLSMVALNPKLEVFYTLSYNQLSGQLVDGRSENLLVPKDIYL
nr:hypothetical protein [Tanacetum cinerariifolium]